jgi:hypothetical protein
MERWTRGRPVPAAVAIPRAHRRLTEKRAGARRRVLLPAIIVYAQGLHHFECAIRDLSDCGARLAVPRTAQFPSSIYLVNVRDMQAHDARLVRRVGTEVGLRLIRAIDLADPNFAFLARLLAMRAARG